MYCCVFFVGVCVCCLLFILGVCGRTLVSVGVSMHGACCLGVFVVCFFVEIACRRVFVYRVMLSVVGRYVYDVW